MLLLNRVVRKVGKDFTLVHHGTSSGIPQVLATGADQGKGRMGFGVPHAQHLEDAPNVLRLRPGKPCGEAQKAEESPDDFTASSRGIRRLGALLNRCDAACLKMKPN